MFLEPAWLTIPKTALITVYCTCYRAEMLPASNKIIALVILQLLANLTVGAAVCGFKETTFDIRFVAGGITWTILTIIFYIYILLVSSLVAFKPDYNALNIIGNTSFADPTKYSGFDFKLILA